MVYTNEVIEIINNLPKRILDRTIAYIDEDIVIFESNGRMRTIDVYIKENDKTTKVYYGYKEFEKGWLYDSEWFWDGSGWSKCAGSRRADDVDEVVACIKRIYRL